MGAFIYLGFVALFVFYTFRFPGEERRTIPLASAKDIIRVTSDVAGDLQERWADALRRSREGERADVSDWYVEGALEDPVLVID